MVAAATTYSDLAHPIVRTTSRIDATAIMALLIAALTILLIVVPAEFVLRLTVDARSLRRRLWSAQLVRSRLLLRITNELVNGRAGRPAHFRRRGRPRSSTAAGTPARLRIVDAHGDEIGWATGTTHSRSSFVMRRKDGPAH